MTTFDPNEKKKLDEFWDKLGYGEKNKRISTDENRIIPSEEIFQTAFSLEKYLEEFIIDNWNSIFPNYDLNEKEIGAQKYKDGEIELDHITDDMVHEHLYTAGIPDPELIKYFHSIHLHKYLPLKQYKNSPNNNFHHQCQHLGQN